MNRQRLTFLLASAALLMLVIVSGMLQQTSNYFYPSLSVRVNDTVVLNLLHEAHRDEAACALFINRISSAFLAQCEKCKLTEARCVKKLTPRQRQMLYGHALDIPTVRIPGGVVAFEGETAALNLENCVETERSIGQRLPSKAQCVPASDALLTLPVASTTAHYPTLVPRLQAFAALVIVAALMSFFVCFVLIYTEKMHSRFSHDQIGSGPQKFHAAPTPRVGGIGIAVGLAGSLLLLGSVGWLKTSAAYGVSLLALAAAPTFAGGLAEDLTKQVGALARLMLTFAAAVIASLLLGATVERTGIILFDFLLERPVVALAFTVFAVGAITNAINVIDGYNGLSSGYAILVLSAIAWVSTQVGDQLVVIASLAMLGALTGFLFWNYPGGKIFMGDGGAYLVGFWLAELSILLVVRNPDVSPWFPIVLLVYPTVEISASVYRKKLLRGMSPGKPDRLHLHMLIHQRLARVNVGSKDPRKITYRNNLVALYVWTGVALVIVPSLFFWRDSVILFCLASVFCLGYLWLYSRLLKWRAPVWMVKVPKW